VGEVAHCGQLSGVEVGVLAVRAVVECRLGDDRLAQQQPPDEQLGDRVEQRDRVQADLVDLARCPCSSPMAAMSLLDVDAEVALDVLECPAELLALVGEVVGARVDQLLDLAGEPEQRRALVAGDLAEEQVQRLDRRRALVERVDLGVADVLLDRVVLREAGAAERLQATGRAARRPSRSSSPSRAAGAGPRA
jgi:hypothetical protein